MKSRYTFVSHLFHSGLKALSYMKDSIEWE